jgi:hypothetical protein
MIGECIELLAGLKSVAFAPPSFWLKSAKPAELNYSFFELLEVS